MAITVTKENYDEIIASEKPVLLDFWAPWCGPCKMMSPVIDEVASDFEGRALVGKVNCDEEGELAEKYKIRSIPSLVFIKNGEVVEINLGVVSKQVVTEKLNKLF